MIGHMCIEYIASDIVSMKEQLFLTPVHRR